MSSAVCEDASKWQEERQRKSIYRETGSINLDKAVTVELAAEPNLAHKGPVLVAVLPYAGGKPLHCNVLVAPSGSMHFTKAPRALQHHTSVAKCNSHCDNAAFMLLYSYTWVLH